MKVTISESRIKKSMTAPPSKSYAHRMMICAALADGISHISGISQSEDMAATADCIMSLGASINKDGSDTQITGMGGRCSVSAEQGKADDLPIFPCRESGSTLRFFIPLAMAVYGGGIFRGTSRLIERGIGIYEDIFSPCDIIFDKSEKEITVRGRLRNGYYKVPGNVSSQFISGLMFALPVLPEDSIIEVTEMLESRAYIDITMEVLRIFGISVIEEQPGIFRIAGGQSYSRQDVSVEGDWSNAAFLYALKELAGDDTICIEGLNESSIQGDRVCIDCLRQLKDAQTEIDLSDCPDLGPILFVMAAAGNGGHFTGIRRLRIKESDRVGTMVSEIAKFGKQCMVTENDMIIPGGELKRPDDVLYGHNDHRVVMALTILATLTGGVIEGAEAVAKSYPDFFEVIKKAGIELRYEY